jgi:surface antigen
VTTIGKLLCLISITTSSAYAGWFGASFSDYENSLAEQSKLVALTYAPQGIKVIWTNKATGASGYSIILYDYPLTMSGNCRLWYEYKQDKDGESKESKSIQCFQNGRGWYGFSSQ